MQQINTIQTEKTLKTLFDQYTQNIDRPLIDEKTNYNENSPCLIFPKISQAFIPQSYKALRHFRKGNLEDIEAWTYVESQNDVGSFIINYISSPYSAETPLVILGHPGSGKSLLTKILSARLVSSKYIPVYIALREVNADAEIQTQIEEYILKATGRSINWANFCDGFQGKQSVIFLDGYDELLQASGKIFANYLKKVQDF